MEKQKAEKTQVFFSRQYRHLKPDSRNSLIFLMVCVVPCVIFFLIYYTKITSVLCFWGKEALSSTIEESSLSIAYSDFLPFFGGVYYIQIPSTMPSFQEVFINLAVTLLVLFILFLPNRNSKGGTPITVYFAIILLIHLIACIFFMFAAEFYPYSAIQYSELYIKQQVSIWLSFLVLTGLLTGILGYGSITGRILVFLGTMAYSFIFGCVRYLTSMFIISTGSSLYMATLFFTLGPLYDFLYLVCFYGMYINAQINRYSEGDWRFKWQWL